jgi:hypothetical protein
MTHHRDEGAKLAADPLIAMTCPDQTVDTGRVTGRTLDPAEIRSLYEQLNAVRKSLDAGDLVAGRGMPGRVEGACVALEVVLGERDVGGLVHGLNRDIRDNG